ncbi:NAD(P)-binding domain-containing protein [Pendulispora brunnea]|uniref:D-3-phosphoglycerate dehydrogenase n=1 Tax=Pendulispora brunnea TaxID=2905690 RepID=A0ABZ2KN48_9BACT
MRVVIADKFPENYLLEFRSLGLEVEYRPEASATELPAIAGDCEILVVRSTKVTRETIEAASRLQLVIRAGAGIDTIDVDAASARGIYVTNCPGKNSVAVAELTVGLILALDRRIPQNTADLRDGQWNKKEYSKADGLKGKTLGIVGLGAIGQAVAQRAAAFEMNLVSYTLGPHLDLAQELGIVPCATLFELAERSDIVTVHIPGTADNRGLFGDAFFARMKHGASFVNTSRGSLHDTAALEKAMRERNLRVGLDVYNPEPEGGTATFDHPLCKLPGFVGTHHIGASTEQAQNAIAAEAVRICREFIKLGQPQSAVNIERASPAKVQLIVRHYDRVGVLASVLAIVRKYGLNVEEMTNTIFAGAKAAVATIRLASAPPLAMTTEIEDLKDQIIQVTVKPF